MTSRPSNVILPLGCGQQPQHQPPDVVLPEPDSPTSPSVSPRRIVELDAVDGFDVGRRAATAARRESENISRDRRRRRASSLTQRLPPAARSRRRSAAALRRVRRRGSSARRGRSRNRRAAPVRRRSASGSGSAARTRSPAAGEEIRRLAFDRHEPPVLAVVQPRQRRQQPLRVRHPRTAKICSADAVFDHVAAVHHQHVLADFGDHAEVVRDQHDRRPGLAAASRSSVRASGPESSRRARSSARRRSAVAGSHESAIAIITRWRMPPEN